MKQGKLTSTDVATADTRVESYTEGKYERRPITRNLLAIQEQFRKSLEVHTPSMQEAEVIQAYLEGYHFSDKTLKDLQTAGRPPEKYNLILRTSRLLEGYFNKVVTTAVAQAVTVEDTAAAAIHNENFKMTQRISEWEATRKAIVGDLINAGMGCAMMHVKDTGRKDDMGRTINQILIDHVPYYQVLPDYRAKKASMADAKFAHVWEYMSYDECVEEFGQDKADYMLTQHEVMDATTIDNDGTMGTGAAVWRNLNEFEHWKDGNSMFVVRTYQVTPQGVDLTYWHGDFELKRLQLPVKRMPILTIPLLRRYMDKRYYSPLYEAIPSQDAINQSLLKFQQTMGSHRVIADKRAVKSSDLPALQRKLKTIDEILHVDNIQGIQVHSMSQEAQAYIDKIYTSIKFILEVVGINEAFLGQSKAGDSGRKFEGQRSASENTLDYIFTPINTMYAQLMRLTIHYSSIYKQATETVRFVDELNQERWLTLNEPFLMPTGNPVPNEQGQYEATPMKRESFDRQSGEWATEFVNERASSLMEIDVEVDIHTAPYDDTDALETAFIDSILNGIGGQVLMGSAPGDILYLYSLMAKNLKTKDSERMAKLLSSRAQQLGALPVEDPRLYMPGGGQQGDNGQGGMNAQSQPGQGSQGSQGAIMSAGGATGDSQPAGYNQPTGGV